MILLVMIVLLFGTGLFFGPRLLRPPRQAAEPADTLDATGTSFKPTPAQWANLKIEPVKMVDFPRAEETDGKIATDDDLTTPVFSPYTGRVVKLYASAGDLVHLGDPLFAVQAVEFAQGQNDLIAAVAALKTARAQLTLSEANEKRQHELFLAHGAAERDWQQAKADLAGAQSGAATAAIALTAVRDRLRILGKTDPEIDAVENATDVRTLNPIGIVSAPIDGTIIQRQVGLGQNIVSAANGNSSGPQFLVGDVSKVWLVANVREQDAPRVHAGDPLEVSVLAFPDRIFNARITRVAASIDPVTHRLPVWAEIDNSGRALKPEMFARFRIITGPSMGATPAVPEQAVVYEGADAHVWLAGESTRTLEIRPVKVGRVTHGLAQVLDGLNAGDQVVTAGAVFIDRAAAGD